MIPLWKQTQSSSAQRKWTQTKHPQSMKESLSKVGEYEARALSYGGHFEGLSHPKVYSTLHMSNLYLFSNFRVYLFLSLSLWLSSFCFSDPRTIKFRLSHRLIIICVICTRGLKVHRSTKVNVGILEYFGNEVAIREYMSYALTTCNHMHHH